MQKDADPNEAGHRKTADLCFVVAMTCVLQLLPSYEQGKLPGRIKKPCGGTMVNVGHTEIVVTHLPTHLALTQKTLQKTFFVVDIGQGHR